jgi:hypothetical protein
MRRDLVALFVVALIIRLAALVVLGPKLGTDGIGYVTSARALLSAGPSALIALPAEHAPLYSVFIAAGPLLGLDIRWFATLVQSLAGAATAVMIARLTARGTDSRVAGLCAGALAAVQISFVFWTTYVLSETLFLFLLAWTADRALGLSGSLHPLRDSAIVGLMAIVSLMVRPTGLAFVAALFILMAVIARARRAAPPGSAGARRHALAPVAAGFCLPFLLVAGGIVLSATVSGPGLPMSAAAHLADWARSGVENGLLETDTGRATAGVDVAVSPPPIIATLPADQQAELLRQGVFTFAAHNPEFVIGQSARKLRLFWTPVLPEYSPTHALASSLYFVPLYALAIGGLVYARHQTALVTLCVSNVLLFTLMSVITIVDYDQRYRLPAELFLVPLAGAGLAWLLLWRPVLPRASSVSSVS